MSVRSRVYRERRLPAGRPLAAIIAGLWRNGEQGVWYDLSDLSTMFQDAAGTLPVYAPGQGQVDPPVGKILDKSGRGNHATQATTTSRPVLSARYNLFTATEFPSGISDTSTRSAGLAAASLSGYAGALAFPAGVTNYGYKPGSVASTVMRLSAIVRMDDGAAPTFGSATPTDLSNDFVFILRGAAVDPTSYVITPLGAGLYHVSATANTGTGSSDFNGIAKYASNSSRPLKVTAYDLRFANDGVGLPPYQRVIDQSNYATVGFPLYLRFDGVDDWMQTASIDFSGSDKILLAAAVRKESDAFVGVICELSVEKNANTGVVALLAPGTNGLATFVWASKGTVEALATATGMPSPISAVLVGLGDISGKISRLRVNGSIIANNAGNQGTGNYGNYALYIGRRSGASLPVKGRIYGLLSRGGELVESLSPKVEKYLNSKARVY